MNYTDAKDYLKKLDTFGSVLGLERMRELTDVLNNPQNDTQIIHITGTNGKGSILCFLSSIMKENGMRVGSFSSPAVSGVRDCFRINGCIISEELFSQCVSEVKEACDVILKRGHEHPTRFEVETAVSFIAFKKSKCDIAIVETGLGGEGDSTNIIDNAVMNIFASVSLDHTRELGPEIEDIARNKAGIIKTPAPVIACADNEKALSVIKNRAKDNAAPVYSVSSLDISNKTVSAKGLYFDYDDLTNIHVSMLGTYQFINAAIAVKATKVLLNLDDETIKKGLHNAKWPYRFEKIKDEPIVYLDGAHNEDAALKLKDTVDSLYKDRFLIYVVGIFQDKNYDRICEITLPDANKVFVTQNELNKRSMDATTLHDVAQKYNNNTEVTSDIKDAVEKALVYAKSNESRNPVIIMFGSLSWLDRARNYVENSV